VNCGDSSEQPESRDYALSKLAAAKRILSSRPDRTGKLLTGSGSKIDNQQSRMSREGEEN